MDNLDKYGGPCKKCHTTHPGRACEGAWWADHVAEHSVREINDHYPTSDWCVDRFLEAVVLPSGLWLEPAAGDGAIVRAATAAFARWRRNGLTKTVATWDTYDIAQMPAEGTLYRRATVANFLTDYKSLDTKRYNVIMTNPPYSLAMEFVQKSLELADHVVMLLRLNFLASAKRAQFFHGFMPDVYVLPNRPSFVNAGKTDMTEYCWMHWDNALREPSGMVRVLGLTPTKERRP